MSLQKFRLVGGRLHRLRLLLVSNEELASEADDEPLFPPTFNKAKPQSPESSKDESMDNVINKTVYGLFGPPAFDEPSDEEEETDSGA